VIEIHSPIHSAADYYHTDRGMSTVIWAVNLIYGNS
jgi:hypothetical protein